jgi:hypothetical protein
MALAVGFNIIASSNFEIASVKLQHRPNNIKPIKIAKL